MKRPSLLQKLRQRLSRYGSFLLLFQRTPAAAQALLPEVNLLASSAAIDSTTLAIVTVVGLGAYDSVAGATSVSQVAPSPGSSTVPVTSGASLSGVFQIVGGGGHTPAAWSVSSGTLPAGLTLKGTSGKTTTLTGITTQAGNHTVTIRAWENSNRSGRSASGTFTLQVTASTPAAIVTQPAPVTIFTGATAKLTVVASGGTPLTYQWYRGLSGDTSQPVGSNAASFTTPALSATTSYWVKVSNALNPGGVASNTATVTVEEPLVPVVSTDPLPAATIGAAFAHTLAASHSPTQFAILGLPKGLTYNATTGAISGRPAVTGSFDLKVTATNAVGSGAEATLPLTVAALPPARVGSFSAWIACDPASNANLGGGLTFTTTSAGSFSLKHVGALGSTGTGATAAAHSAKGFLAATAPQIVVPLGMQTLSLSLDAGTGAVTGSLGSAPVTGGRNVWNARTQPATALQGYYSFALDLAEDRHRNGTALTEIPQGSGYVTGSVDLNGVFKYAGKTADGQALTGSRSVDSGGAFSLYHALYQKSGSLVGPLLINALALDPTERPLIGSLTWSKPASSGRSYVAGFGAIPLAADGNYLAPAGKGHIALGLPAAGPVQLRFSGAGLELSDTDPNLAVTWTADHKLQLPATNPAKVGLSLNPANGAMKGSFTLVDTAPPLTRKVAFLGQLVRGSDGTVKATGHFLLPQLPDAGQKANATPILSGRVRLEQ